MYSSHPRSLVKCTYAALFGSRFEKCTKSALVCLRHFTVHLGKKDEQPLVRTGIVFKVGAVVEAVSKVRIEEILVCVGQTRCVSENCGRDSTAVQLWWRLHRGRVDPTVFQQDFGNPPPMRGSVIAVTYFDPAGFCTADNFGPRLVDCQMQGQRIRNACVPVVQHHIETVVPLRVQCVDHRKRQATFCFVQVGVGGGPPQ